MRAEDKLRYEMTKCRNCETCKTLLDFTCMVFPEMFRLMDEERDRGKNISIDDLMQLVNKCNFCATCPCLDVRAAIMNAKTEYMDKCGLSLENRIMEHVEYIGKLGETIPQLSNLLLQNNVIRRVIELILGIHRERNFPIFPKESFSGWMERRRNKGLSTGSEGKKKVAYFSGCTGRYFFPEVPKAAVEIFERNGIQVYFPDQRCCGMPSLLEGDRKLTLELARFNIASLVNAVQEGFDIVCSCPTCGYMLKTVIKAGASFSPDCRKPVKSRDGFVKMPLGQGALSTLYRGFIEVPNEVFERMLTDEGYFSSISPEKRIMVAENTYDVGAYLRKLHTIGGLDTRLGSMPERCVYYPPCHLREQNTGTPYQYLLGLIPGLSLEVVKGNYCCGNAGIMGFKKKFHHISIKIASRLIAKIRSLNPEVLITDCLSCRIQFNQLTPYKVLHPIQIIKESYVSDMIECHPEFRVVRKGSRQDQLLA